MSQINLLISQMKEHITTSNTDFSDLCVECTIEVVDVYTYIFHKQIL